MPRKCWVLATRSGEKSARSANAHGVALDSAAFRLHAPLHAPQLGLPPERRHQPLQPARIRQTVIICERHDLAVRCFHTPLPGRAERATASIHVPRPCPLRHRPGLRIPTVIHHDHLPIAVCLLANHGERIRQ